MLLYVNFSDTSKLLYWFVVEFVILAFNVFILAAFVLFVPKVRVHINVKILVMVGALFYFPCMLGRMVIMCYETGVLTPSLIRPCNGTSCVLSHNPVIVVASFFRTFFFAILLSSLFWMALERVAALHFIRDYEKNQRMYVSVTICSAAAVLCFSFSAAFTFELTPFVPLVIFGLLLTMIGILVYVDTYKKSKQMFESFGKTGCSSHEYSLSIRFQIEENLWCAGILRNLFVIIAGINVSTVGVFFLSNLKETKEFFGGETTEYLDCGYNMLVALNGPVIIIGWVTYNKYLSDNWKKVYFGGKKIQCLDEVDTYFDQLKKQWEPIDGKMTI